MWQESMPCACKNKMKAKIPDRVSFQSRACLFVCSSPLFAAVAYCVFLVICYCNLPFRHNPIFCFSLHLSAHSISIMKTGLTLHRLFHPPPPFIGDLARLELLCALLNNWSFNRTLCFYHGSMSMALRVPQADTQTARERGEMLMSEDRFWMFEDDRCRKSGISATLLFFFFFAL